MELPVLIDSLPDRPGYVAHLGPPFNLTAEAATADEALQQVTELLQSRLQQGAQLRAVTITAAGRGHPGGWLPDDELTREWLQHVEQYRQECDEADQRRLLVGPDEENATSMPSPLHEVTAAPERMTSSRSVRGDVPAPPPVADP